MWLCIDENRDAGPHDHINDQPVITYQDERISYICIYNMQQHIQFNRTHLLLCLLAHIQWLPTYWQHGSRRCVLVTGHKFIHKKAARAYQTCSINWSRLPLIQNQIKYKSKRLIKTHHLYAAPQEMWVIQTICYMPPFFFI